MHYEFARSASTVGALTRTNSIGVVQKRGVQVNYRFDSEARPAPIWIPAADRLELAGSPMPAENPVQHR